MKRNRVISLVGVTFLCQFGCKGEPAGEATPAVKNTDAPTRNDMPPEVKRQMEKQQADMKARAEAQGKAMQDNKR